MAKKPKTFNPTERKKLERARAQTLAELERLREYVKVESDPSTDEADLDVHEREKNLALVRRLETKIEEIDKAIQVAQKGTYGICERCGKPIDPARLKALPETTLCIQCKNALEKLTRRGAR